MPRSFAARSPRRSSVRAISARSRAPTSSRGSSVISWSVNAMPLREIAGPAGRLEALLDEPAARGIGADGMVASGGPLRSAVVLAHPLTTHGGTMHTKAVYQAAKALTRIG